MELYVFLNKSDIPKWQEAIEACGFGLKLDMDFDPFTFTGFLPSQLDEQITGFEYYFSPKQNIAAPDTYLVPLVETYDSVVSFIWGGNFNELAAVLIAASSLSNSCASLMHLPDDQSSIKGPDALSYARQQLAEIEKYRKKNS